MMDTDFVLNVETIAERLQISTARLSQLTSQGMFSFERRRVQGRSRLFYRETDIANYELTQATRGYLKPESLKQHLTEPKLNITTNYGTAVAGNLLEVLPKIKNPQQRTIDKIQMQHSKMRYNSAIEIANQKNNSNQNFILQKKIDETDRRILEQTQTIVMLKRTIQSLEKKIHANLETKPTDTKRTAHQSPWGEGSHDSPIISKLPRHFRNFYPNKPRNHVSKKHFK